MATTQQRTSPVRQKLSAAQRKLAPNLAWDITGTDDDVVTVRLFGAQQGIVVRGIPAFVIEPFGYVAIAATYQPNTPTLGSLLITMSAPIPPVCRLALLNGEPQVINGLGGILLPGNQAITNYVPPPEPIVVISGVAGGGGVVLTVTNIGTYSAVGETPVIACDTPPEYCNGASWVGGLLQLTFPSGDPPSGSIISSNQINAMIYNNFGGQLQPFSITIP